MLLEILAGLSCFIQHRQQAVGIKIRDLEQLLIGFVFQLVSSPRAFRFDVSRTLVEYVQKVDVMSNTLKERVAALEAEVASFRHNSSGAPQTGTTLVAPVRIVDSSGALLAEITRSTHETAVTVFNTQGEAVATLGADGTYAGYLAIRNASGQLLAYLDVEHYGGRLQLNDTRHGGLLFVGGDCDEQGGFSVARSDGVIAAEFWATEGGGKLTFYQPGQDSEALVLPDALLKEP